MQSFSHAQQILILCYSQSKHETLEEHGPSQAQVQLRFHGLLGIINSLQYQMPTKAHLLPLDLELLPQLEPQHQYQQFGS